MITTLLYCCVFSLNQQPKPVAAIVLSYSGSPTRSDGKNSRLLAAYDRLRVDDVVEAGPKSSVTIYFQEDGHKEVIHAGASVVIGQKGGMAKGKVDVIGLKLQGENVGLLREAILAGKIGGSLVRKSVGIAPAIAPVDEAIVVSDRPTFRWPAVEKAERYRVALLTAGGKPVWTKECTVAMLNYPGDAKPLARVIKYQWAVTAIFTNGDEKTILKDRTFTVGTVRMAKQAETWKKLAESPDPTDKLIAAVGLEHLGLLDELYPLYAEITKKVTNDPKLFVICSVYSAKAGLRKESDEAWQKALNLGWREIQP